MSLKKCRSCMQAIDKNAKKCHHCGSTQNPLLNKLQSVSLVLSTLVAIVSLYGAYSADKQAEEARKAKDIAEKAVQDIKKLDNKLTKGMSTVGAEMGGLDETIALAKKNINSLINVESIDGNNVLDIDGKVRIQWGKFQTKKTKDEKQEPVIFGHPFGDDNVAVALTIIGNPSRKVEGKSIIAKHLDSKGFIPKVSDQKFIALGVEVNYVAFGKTPH